MDTLGRSCRIKVVSLLQSKRVNKLLNRFFTFLKSAPVILQNMNASANKQNTIGRRFSSALLFALAVLLLAVSCPVKRFFNTNFANSTQQNSKQESQPGKAAKYQSTSCCSLKQKTILVKASFKKQNAPAPDVVLTGNSQSGFDINHFLSRTRSNQLSSAPTTIPSLPLFLQHRRLLI
jgi:hypothetical protein